LTLHPGVMMRNIKLCHHRKLRCKKQTNKQIIIILLNMIAFILNAALVSKRDFQKHVNVNIYCVLFTHTQYILYGLIIFFNIQQL